MKPCLSGFWTRIAYLFLIRSGRITAALSFMVVTAVAALIFLSALAVGVEDAMLRNTVGLFSGHITGYELPASVQREKLLAPGVHAVLKRTYLPGMLSMGSFSHPATLCGVNAARESAVTALEKKINKGRYPAPGRHEILISRDLAEIFNVRIDDVLRFSRQPGGNSLDFSVSGIYQAGLPGLDRGLTFCSLDMIPAKDASWSAAGRFPEWRQGRRRR